MAYRYADHAVGIKILKHPIDNDADPDIGKDFSRECETLMAIRHAHLLIFYGAGLMERSNRPFLVTEYMALGSLKKLFGFFLRALLGPF